MVEDFEKDAALLLEGPRGCGKTALRDALRRAKEADGAVVIDTEDKVEQGSALETDVLARWSL